MEQALQPCMERYEFVVQEVQLLRRASINVSVICSDDVSHNDPEEAINSCQRIPRSFLKSGIMLGGKSNSMVDAITIIH